MRSPERPIRALGYVRVEDPADSKEIARQDSEIVQHCRVHGIELVCTNFDAGPQTAYFQGPGWRELMRRLEENPDYFQALVISRPEVLCREKGLYLLTQFKLLRDYQVVVDIARGRELGHFFMPFSAS